MLRKTHILRKIIDSLALAEKKWKKSNAGKAYRSYLNFRASRFSFIIVAVIDFK